MNRFLKRFSYRTRAANVIRPKIALDIALNDG